MIFLSIHVHSLLCYTTVCSDIFDSITLLKHFSVCSWNNTSANDVYLYSRPCSDPTLAVVFGLYSARHCYSSSWQLKIWGACWCMLTTVINTFILSNTAVFPQLTTRLFWKRRRHMLLFCSFAFCNGCYVFLLFLEESSAGADIKRSSLNSGNPSWLQ